jgi:hypothetical protein
VKRKRIFLYEKEVEGQRSAFCNLSKEIERWIRGSFSISMNVGGGAF